MELYSEHFMNFFDRVEVANFEIASDAFSSFKVRQHSTAQRSAAQLQQAAAAQHAMHMCKAVAGVAAECCTASHAAGWLPVTNVAAVVIELI